MEPRPRNHHLAGYLWLLMALIVLAGCDRGSSAEEETTQAAAIAPTSMPNGAEAQQAADCRRLLEVLGADRAHLVGHSYGGAIALQLATDAPDLVQTLALLEPALMVGSSGPDYRESLG